MQLASERCCVARRVCTALTLRLGILIKHFSIEKSLSLFRLRLFSRAIIGNVDRYILGSLEFRNQRKICRCGKIQLLTCKQIKFTLDREAERDLCQIDSGEGI